MSLALRKAVLLKTVACLPSYAYEQTTNDYFDYEITDNLGRKGALAPREVSHKYGCFPDIKLLFTIKCVHNRIW